MNDSPTNRDMTGGQFGAGPMDAGHNETPVSHRLLLSLFKLFQLVKIHQANNKLVIETIADFRQALHEICLESDGANIRVYRGRIYLNQERLNFKPTMMVAVTKLIEFLQSRRIHSLRMYEKAELTDAEVVFFIDLMNRSAREKDPVAWMQVQLDKENQTWVELQSENDVKKLSPSDTALATLAVSVGASDNQDKTKDGTRQDALDNQDDPEAGPDENADESSEEGGPDENGAEGQGREKNKKIAPAMIDLAQRTYAQVMASMARKTYSHALTSILAMSVKGSVNKKVGIQKSKRVIQGMIEILTKDESVLLGMSTIRNYDDYTYTHSVNVAILAMCLGRRLGLSRRAVEQVGLCGLFHDLGKVDVPIELITKTAKLTEDEYEKVKTHSISSVRQIIRLNADHLLKTKLILPPFEHHLGIDLSGYPQTDRKMPVSLLGRILAVADHYDAMTSSRSYRKVPISPDVALKIMMEEAGSVLDPIILKIFIEMIGVYPVGSLLVLDTHEVGLAAITPPDAEGGRPVVCLLTRSVSNKIKKSKIVDLSEKDPETGHYLRNIVDCFHPSRFGIQPADFLV